jgi:putative ribosome biogenesis GTPase RsgA
MERDLIQTVINSKETRSNWRLDRSRCAAEIPTVERRHKRRRTEVMQSRDTFGSVHGTAGVGKTTFVKTLQPSFEAHGYEVKGLAATSGAVKEMQAVGIEAQTYRCT